MRTVVSPFYTPTGNKVDVLDPHALQTELNNMESAISVLQQSTLGVDDALKQLNDRMMRLERLYDFVNRDFPHVLADFLATEGAKAKLGVAQGPPVQPQTQSELDAALERYRYMRP